MGGDRSRLVRLQPADEMPAGRRPLATERDNLGQGLVQVVLTEVGETQVTRGEQRGRRMPLADREKRDGLGGAAGRRRGGVDAPAQCSELGRQTRGLRRNLRSA
jgi:hypothetical protein